MTRSAYEERGQVHDGVKLANKPTVIIPIRFLFGSLPCGGHAMGLGPSGLRERDIASVDLLALNPVRRRHLVRRHEGEQRVEGTESFRPVYPLQELRHRTDHDVPGLLQAVRRGQDIDVVANVRPSMDVGTGRAARPRR